MKYLGSDPVGSGTADILIKIKKKKFKKNH
jgi:hypothetical protein